MILLEADTARAVVAIDGAEIKLWTVAGMPLIWEPDPKIWSETAPLLFPVVGWTKNGQERVDGKSYPLGLHGFARHRRYEILEQKPESIRLQLQSDAGTLALYPFEFSLIVEHKLSGCGLQTILEVRNSGTRDMPYACGVHPGLRWPFAGGDPAAYRIRFDKAEDPDMPMIGADGLMTKARKHLPLKGTDLSLDPALFAVDALCFLNARSHGYRFEAPDGAAIRVDVADFPHLAFWCRPGHGYLCLEAWTGYSDPDDFAGDLFEKPSMRLLAPGGVARHAATYSYEPPGSA